MKKCYLKYINYIFIYTNTHTHMPAIFDIIIKYVYKYVYMYKIIL